MPSVTVEPLIAVASVPAARLTFPVATILLAGVLIGKAAVTAVFDSGEVVAAESVAVVPDRRTIRVFPGMPVPVIVIPAWMPDALASVMFALPLEAVAVVETDAPVTVNDVPLPVADSVSGAATSKQMPLIQPPENTGPALTVGLNSVPSPTMLWFRPDTGAKPPDHSGPL